MAKRGRKPKPKNEPEINAGIRMTIPEIIRRAEIISKDLICRHGAIQAATIGQIIAEKTLAVRKIQGEK